MSKEQNSLNTEKLEQAVHSLLAEQHEEAINHCRAVLDSDPKSPQAHYILGEIFQSTKRLESAVEHFSLAIQYEKSDLTKLQNRLRHKIKDQVGAKKTTSNTEDIQQRLVDPDEPEINQVEKQRENWSNALLKEDWDSPKPFGYSYGDPEDANHMYGNYLEIKTRLRAHAGPDKVVLEIGTLAGKWVQYFLDSKQFICVDINDVGFEYIKKRFSNPTNFSYYLTLGDELNGIPDNSIDLVYSMDSLVRAPKQCIRRYFQESCRVLKPGGRLLLHLPCTEIEWSRNAGFTKLNLEEIKEFVVNEKFDNIHIDGKVIKHGVIVEATCTQ